MYPRVRRLVSIRPLLCQRGIYRYFFCRHGRSTPSIDRLYPCPCTSMYELGCSTNVKEPCENVSFLLISLIFIGLQTSRVAYKGLYISFCLGQWPCVYKLFFGKLEQTVQKYTLTVWFKNAFNIMWLLHISIYHWFTISCNNICLFFYRP